MHNKKEFKINTDDMISKGLNVGRRRRKTENERGQTKSMRNMYLGWMNEMEREFAEFCK